MSKHVAKRRPWSKVDQDFLRERYAVQVTEVLARALDRTVSQVYRQAWRMGLEKSKAFVAETARARTLQAHHGGRAYQFPKGIVPWNKGLHHVAGGRSAETRFRQGQQPHNTLPLGSLRLCDGYLQRKMTETGYPPRDWVPEHRLVWIKAYGLIPEGHVVIFRGGVRLTDPDQITADKLECISRGELARRNHPRSKHPELGRLVALKGAITRQVNRLAREAKEARQ